MEIYKDLNSDASKEFEKLLNSQLSKNKIEEGSIVQAEITKISDKFCYCYIGGMKSEAMIDLSEFKSIDQQDKIKVGSKIEVLLENIESKSGEIIVSIEKAHKQKGFDILKKAYENKEHRTGMIVGKVKGGVLFKDKETGILTFMPGSQISQRPMKDINSLMNKEFKAAIIKLDLVRGNLCTSRRAVISAEKEEDKKTIIERYKVGDKISGVCKSLSSFGAFLTGKNVEIRTSIAYNNASVVLVGTHGGLIGPDGATQSGIQDVSVMRSIPRMKVFQPSSPVLTHKILSHCISLECPSYIRVARNEVAEIYENDLEFVEGHPIYHGEESDIMLISSGPMVHNCLAAAKILKENQSIKVGVIDVPSIKPLNSEVFFKLIRKSKLLVSVEDHMIEGGIGSMIAETISSSDIRTKLYIKGLNGFVGSGKPADLEKRYSLDRDSIVAFLLERLI